MEYSMYESYFKLRKYERSALLHLKGKYLGNSDKYFS